MNIFMDLEMLLLKILSRGLLHIMIRAGCLGTNVQDLSPYFYNNTNAPKRGEQYEVSLYYIKEIPKEGKVYYSVVFFDSRKKKLYETMDYDTVNLFQFHFLNCEHETFTFKYNPKERR